MSTNGAVGNVSGLQIEEFVGREECSVRFLGIRCGGAIVVAVYYPLNCKDICFLMRSVNILLNQRQFLIIYIFFIVKKFGI